MKLLLVLDSTTVLPVKIDSDAMICLQSYQGLRIDRSLVYKSYPQDAQVKCTGLLSNCKKKCYITVSLGWHDSIMVVSLDIQCAYTNLLYYVACWGEITPFI